MESHTDNETHITHITPLSTHIFENVEQRDQFIEHKRTNL